MKRSSSTYRLNMIKDVALKKQHEYQGNEMDPMASYIRRLLIEKPHSGQKVELESHFTGSHFDESAGGWVSDRWK